MIRSPDHGPYRGRVLGKPKPGGRVAPGYFAIVDGDFRSPGERVTGKHPATCISKREAQAYLAWLSKKANRSYRLPTEAEWEYAVRAGSTTPYHFGNRVSDLCKFGNFADRASGYGASMAAPCAENPSPAMLAPVGSYQPNRWGIFDLIGNTFEFVEDCYHPNYRGAPADGSPWLAGTNNSACPGFVTRGYFFDSVSSGLRSAARCLAATSWDDRSNGLAIRVVVSIDEISAVR
jgi:formylglycine-generating enzyme required for sulfatase activity